MKLVNFDEFVKYPEGTIFSYFNPDVFYGLFVKKENIKGYDLDREVIDYFQVCLEPRLSWDDKEIELGQKERWGEFDHSQQYCIYEEQDVNALKKVLNDIQN